VHLCLRWFQLLALLGVQAVGVSREGGHPVGGLHTRHKVEQAAQPSSGFCRRREDNLHEGAQGSDAEEAERVAQNCVHHAQ
jgi:hypothetical protein